MNQKVIIRNETSTDADAITEVTIEAFKTLEISSHTEQFIIGQALIYEGLSQLKEIGAR